MNYQLDGYRKLVLKHHYTGVVGYKNEKVVSWLLKALSVFVSKNKTYIIIILFPKANGLARPHARQKSKSIF